MWHKFCIWFLKRVPLTLLVNETRNRDLFVCHRTFAEELYQMGLFDPDKKGVANGP